MKGTASFAFLALPWALALAAASSAQISGPTRMREVIRHGEPRAWTVDSAGGGDFFDLPQAVAAARSGDVIVVRQAGVRYRGFTTSKGLTVVGRAGNRIPCSFTLGPSTDRPCVLGEIRIQSLPADESFVLRGIALYENIDGISETQVLEVDSCAGVVWVEDCSITLSCSGPFGCGAHAMRVEDSPRVVLTRSSSVSLGGTGGQVAPVLDALSLEGASVFAFESELVGHPGIQPLSGPGGTGGRGTGLSGASFLFASGSSFQGGAAGSSICAFFQQSCLSAGSGGSG